MARKKDSPAEAIARFMPGTHPCELRVIESPATLAKRLSVSNGHVSMLGHNLAHICQMMRQGGVPDPERPEVLLIRMTPEMLRNMELQAEMMMQAGLGSTVHFYSAAGLVGGGVGGTVAPDSPVA
jgi:hypothetical protein